MGDGRRRDESASGPSRSRYPVHGAGLGPGRIAAGRGAGLPDAGAGLAPPDLRNLGAAARWQRAAAPAGRSPYAIRCPPLFARRTLPVLPGFVFDRRRVRHARRRPSHPAAGAGDGPGRERSNHRAREAEPRLHRGTPADRLGCRQRDRSAGRAGADPVPGRPAGCLCARAARHRVHLARSRVRAQHESGGARSCERRRTGGAGSRRQGPDPGQRAVRLRELPPIRLDPGR